MSRIASRYSKSLLEFATENNEVEQVKNDMDSIVSLCGESRELMSLLKNPVVKSADKKAILSKVFASASDSSKQFIDFLITKKRESELSNVASKYVDAYNSIKGIANVTVISAVALSEETMEQVKKYAVGMVGKDQIELVNKVDSTIIGGLVIKHEDKLLDMSVSKELREIRKTLIYN